MFAKASFVLSESSGGLGVPAEQYLESGRDSLECGHVVELPKTVKRLAAAKVNEPKITPTDRQSHYFTPTSICPSTSVSSLKDSDVICDNPTRSSSANSYTIATFVRRLLCYTTTSRTPPLRPLRVESGFYDSCHTRLDCLFKEVPLIFDLYALPPRPGRFLA